MILGIFDSGLGGLTVLKEILKNNIYEKIVYYGDTLRLPYGEKDKDTLLELTKNDIEFLLKKGAEEIVMACGTVSTNVLDSIKDNYAFRIIGIVDIACKEAAKITKNGKIGILATPATVRTGEFTRKIKKICGRNEVFEIPCQKLTPLIEGGKKDSLEMEEALNEYLTILKEKNVDTIILGCTHYPIIADKIDLYFDGKVKLINCGELISNEINDGEYIKPKIEFYVSGNTEDFLKLAKNIINIEEINNVKNY